MKLEEISDINKWFNETDLVEIEFKKGDCSLNLVKEGEKKGNTKISSALSSIVSPDIGVFSFTKKGKSVSFKEGDSVKKGDVVGYIDVMGKNIEVVSNVDGKIKVVCVNDNDIVEYSQLLFIVE
jgi:acetyl-CoA carboxylase biotin carboxyl carrier protein